MRRTTISFVLAMFLAVAPLGSAGYLVNYHDQMLFFTHVTIGSNPLGGNGDLVDVGLKNQQCGDEDDVVDVGYRNTEGTGGCDPNVGGGCDTSSDPPNTIFPAIGDLAILGQILRALKDAGAPIPGGVEKTEEARCSDDGDTVDVGIANEEGSQDPECEKDPEDACFFRGDNEDGVDLGLLNTEGEDDEDATDLGLVNREGTPYGDSTCPDRDYDGFPHCQRQTHGDERDGTDVGVLNVENQDDADANDVGVANCEEYDYDDNLDVGLLNTERRNDRSDTLDLSLLNSETSDEPDRNGLQMTSPPVPFQFACPILHHEIRDTANQLLP